MQSAVSLESDAAILYPECRQMAAKVRTVLKQQMSLLSEAYPVR
jgi:hypothetical protein